MPFTLTSSDFKDHGSMPRELTCEGAGHSPPLAWENPPAGTKSFALIVDDPDAPDPAHPKTVWVHWVLYNLPPSTTSLSRQVESLPPGTMQGLNDFKREGYGGPCPPIGRHRYFHKLYALDALLPDLGTPTKAEVEKAMRPHVLAEAVLIGTYLKEGKRQS